MGWVVTSDNRKNISVLSTEFYEESINQSRMMIYGAAASL